MTTKQLVQEQLLTMAHWQYERDLNTHAFYKLRDRAVSQDLVQTTFLKE